MVKDPFYRQILAALSRELDGVLFETCACDLLRGRYPTLVPVSGGNDGGMDGAIADGEGEAYPFICTTRERVIDNLKESLESHFRTGGLRQKIVVATSRALTPKQRRDLRDRARDLGCTLVQVYEQRAIAALLYRDSRWCQDLLDLTGKAAALSVLPPGFKRPLVELELLGREADVEWLRVSSKDRVLVGDPGAGKTYLLYRLALEGWGLFLASDEEDEISNAIRDQRPDVIIVDDAHVDPERLENLAGLRRRIGATFSIVATTWKGSRDDIAVALNVPAGRIHTLEPLSRQQILQIFEEIGVEAPEEYLRELVDQAANKPGLATTLAALWLEGDWFSVLRGEALTRDSLRSVRRLVGRDEEGLLAVFSLGGRCGMPPKETGERLGLNVLETRERLSSLSAAGILSEGGDCLAVQPRALRSVLLSSVFFTEQSPRLDYRDFLDLAPGYDCAVREIVTAAARGAQIPFKELCRLLRQLDPGKYPLRKEWSAAWGMFAGIGKREALWAFEHYPGELVDIAREGLRSAPEATIQRLLEQTEAACDSESWPTYPQLTVLWTWLNEITYPVKETLERRRKALQIARRYAKARESTGAFAVAFRLGCLTLSPEVQSERIDPTRTGLIVRREYLSQAQWKQMDGIWKEALELFKITGLVSLPQLSCQLREWLRLSDAQEEESEERRIIQLMVIEMLQDLTPFAAGRIGVSSALIRWAQQLGVELPLVPDPRFEVIFPPISARWARDTSPLEALVDEWSGESPAEIGEALCHLTQEAKGIAIRYQNRVYEICRMLARRVRKPGLWFEAWTAMNAPSPWVAPFLDRLSSSASFGNHVLHCLHSETYVEIGIRAALRLPEPSPGLLEEALKRALDHPFAIEGMGLRGELSTSVAKALLSHPDPALALEAAFGEWMAEPKGEVRPELGRIWREAVLRSTGIETPNRVDSYQLEELVASDPELAFEWLVRLGVKTSNMAPEFEDAAESAVALLGRQRRQDLLDRLSADSVLIDLLPQLIDRNVELYRRLLHREALEDSHLLPLQGTPESNWATLANTALREGFGPEEVAKAAYSGDLVWLGTGEDYWRRWDDAFASLDRPADADPAWEEMIRHCREYAQRRIKMAEEEGRGIERDGLIRD